MIVKASSGSGTKISLHAGSTLASSHLEFDIHLGTSGGAAIEPLHAVGKFKEIEEYGKSYILTNYFDYEPFGVYGLARGFVRLLTLKPSMFTINNFYKFYSKLYTKEDHIKLIKSDKKVYVGVNGLLKDKIVFDITKLSYEGALKAIAASTSIPLFTPPVKFYNDFLLDGGIRNHIETEYVLKEYSSKIKKLYSFYSRPDQENISKDKIDKKDLRWYNILANVYEKMQFDTSKNDEIITDKLCNIHNIEHKKYFAPYKLTSNPYEHSLEKNIEFFNIGKNYIVD